MKDLIRVSMTKLTRFRTFWKFLILIVVSTFLITWAVSSLYVEGINHPSASQAIDPLFLFPDIWFVMAWVAKFSHIFMTFLLISFVVADFDSNMIKQHIINGWSRERVLVYFSTINGFLSLLPVIMTCFLVMMFHKDTGWSQFFDIKSVSLLAKFFLQSFTKLQFTLLLILFLKRSGPVIIVYVSWPLLIEPIVGKILDSKVYAGAATYLPFYSIDGLFGLPISIQNLSLNFSAGVSDTFTLMMSFIYLGFFTGISWYKLKTTDL